MNRFWGTAVAVILAIGASLAADSVDVTFRYPAPVGTPLRVFLPGEFNGWGGTVDGRIDPASSAKMTYVTEAGMWIKKVRLAIGTTYAYKLHLHLNADGSSYEWLADPLNPLKDSTVNGNSLVPVTGLMIFEPAVTRSHGGSITGIAAGVFSRAGLTHIRLVVNGDSTDIGAARDGSTGILSYIPPAPISADAVDLVAIDALGKIAVYHLPAVAKKRKLDVTLLFHANQGLVPYSRVADRASFRGLLTTLRKHPGANIQLHISGTTVHDLLWFGDSTLQLVREGIADGQFEIFGSAYAQNVMYSTRSDTGDFAFNDHQIKIQRAQIQRTFGVTPTAFWNPERVWTQNFVQLLADNGYTCVPVEDHILEATGTTRSLFGVRTTRFNGRQLTVFPDSKPFLALIDEAINTGDVVPVLNYLHARYAEDVNDEYIVSYYEDAEAVGLWDYEHGVDPETNFRNLDHLLTALEEDSVVNLTTYSKFLASHTPVEELTPIRNGGADWMGRDAWFVTNQDPRFASLRVFYDGVRKTLDSVQTEIRSFPGDTAAAAALLRHAWFTLCAHQFEFGCVGLEYMSGAADANMARASFVAAAAARYALHPATLTIRRDIDRDGVEDVVMVSPGDLWVLSPKGGRLLYWFDLTHGEQLVGNENFLTDYNEPYVDATAPVPLVRGGVNTFPWLAANTLLPEIFTWEFEVRRRALNDVLTLGADASHDLAGRSYTATIDGSAVTFETAEGGVRIRKTLTPQTSGMLVRYRLSSTLGAPAQLVWEVRNSLSPSLLQAMDHGRSGIAYVNGSGGVAQTVTASTIGVVNTTSGSSVRYAWGNVPDQLIGKEDVFALELNPRYARTLGAGDSTEISFTLSRSTVATAITSADAQLPSTVILAQNFPNPFNPTTVIGYHLPAAGRVTLRVVDLLGRTVRVLVDGDQSAGAHREVFDAHGLASGVYYYALTASGTTQVRKMLVLR